MNDNVFILVLISIGGIFIVLVSFIIIFIRNQNNRLKQKGQLQQVKIEHQRELLKAVIVSQEAERKRIGQDLHDDVGTALSNLRITIEMFTEGLPNQSDSFSNTCKNLIDKVIQDVRHISHNLSPPGIELYGFTGALEELCEFITLTGKLQIKITDKTSTLIDKLLKSSAITLYRVMQELLHNTLKHANASLTEISYVLEDNCVVINYWDNGQGITKTDTHKIGMGMQNIESRLGAIGASFLINTSENAGFNIRIKLNTAIKN